MAFKERIDSSRRTKIIMQLSTMSTEDMVFKQILDSVNEGYTQEKDKLSENGLRTILTDMGKTYIRLRNVSSESVQRQFNREVANLLIALTKSWDEKMPISPLIYAMASETLEME